MAKYSKTKKTKKTNRKHVLYFLIILVVVATGTLFYWQTDKSKSTSKLPKLTNDSSSKSSSKSISSVKSQQFSIDEAASLWVVVNKGRTLPSTYVPNELINPDIPLTSSSSNENMKIRSDTAAALTELSQAARSSSIVLRLTSGYRSYSTQAALNASYAQSQGQAEADKTSAHAGHSEHQTGLAVDVEPLDGRCRLDVCFGDTPEGKWLVDNAHKYGFIIRYPKDKENMTGYSYEPWHLRYVGKELAEALYNSSKTMEEYFGLNFYKYYPPKPLQLN